MIFLKKIDCFKLTKYRDRKGAKKIKNITSVVDRRAKVSFDSYQ